jgi:hypothetical protein
MGAISSACAVVPLYAPFVAGVYVATVSRRRRRKDMPVRTLPLALVCVGSAVATGVLMAIALSNAEMLINRMFR